MKNREMNHKKTIAKLKRKLTIMKPQIERLAVEHGSYLRKIDETKQPLPRWENGAFESIEYELFRKIAEYRGIMGLVMKDAEIEFDSKYRIGFEVEKTGEMVWYV